MQMAPFQILNCGILLNHQVLQIEHLTSMMFIGLPKTTATAMTLIMMMMIMMRMAGHTGTNGQRHLQGVQPQEHQGDPDRGGQDKLHQVLEGEVQKEGFPRHHGTRQTFTAGFPRHRVCMLLDAL
jgi:hypothetical protein